MSVVFPDHARSRFGVKCCQTKASAASTDLYLHVELTVLIARALKHSPTYICMYEIYTEQLKTVLF